MAGRGCVGGREHGGVKGDGHRQLAGRHRGRLKTQITHVSQAQPLKLTRTP